MLEEKDDALSIGDIELELAFIEDKLFFNN
jgi:hypothetical protein